MAKGQANASYRLRDEGKMSPTHKVNRLAQGERELGALKPGDMIEALSWTIMTPSKVRLGMRAIAGKVAIFMYLASKNVDAVPKQDDFFKVMHALGWQPIDPDQRKAFMAKVKG